MCGIVGITSNIINNKNNGENASILLKSLSKLEYRGYDSLGFSYIKDSGDLFTQKSPERISDFINNINFTEHKFSTGIAHTRWATHGGVNQANAHPHEGEFASLIHNGIIENYLEIKDELLLDGYKFKSQTDSEVVVHLVSKIIKQSGIKNSTDIAKLSYDEKFALCQNIASHLLIKLKGAFAIAIIIKNCDGYLLGLKNKAPMIAGFGDNANYLASDGYAIGKLTNKITTMNDMSYAILTSKDIFLYDKANKILNYNIEIINYQDENDTKGTFSTFMEKEIYEQPQAIKNNIQNHLKDDNTIHFANANFDFSGFKKISLIACGTSFYAATLFCYQAISITKIPCECDIASEFRYKDIVFEKDTLYILMSQSGETADTIAALDFINENKQSGSKTLAIINVKHSTIAKKSDGFIECFSGREISVASTKNFTNQVLSLLFVAIKIAQSKNIAIDNDIFSSIKSLSAAFYQFLFSIENIEKVKKMAQKISMHKKVMFVARSLLYPIALEGALKLKELSYLPTEGIASGELKHGPIAVVDENLVCVCLLSNYILKNKTESSIQEILARNGSCIIISDYKFENSNPHNLDIDISSITKNINKFVLPLLFIPIVQLLSFFTATQMGMDVDKPRNLAKSVTVE